MRVPQRPDPKVADRAVGGERLRHVLWLISHEKEAGEVDHFQRPVLAEQVGQLGALVGSLVVGPVRARSEMARAASVSCGAGGESAGESGQGRTVAGAAGAAEVAQLIARTSGGTPGQGAGRPPEGSPAWPT